MNDKRAVIFDMDGVLVDTYRAHFESWQVVAAEEDWSFDEAQFAPTFGRTSREVIAALWAEGRYDEARVAELDDRKEAAFRRIIREHFPAMPGARELLITLREAGFALAVGSSGPPANVELVLDRLDARVLFDAVVTGADVTRGKPDPQVFLTAAGRLGVRAERSAVIEDAPAGIAAARAARMVPVGLASTGRTRESLSGAALVVDSLAELSPELLARLIDR